MPLFVSVHPGTLSGRPRGRGSIWVLWRKMVKSREAETVPHPLSSTATRRIHLHPSHLRPGQGQGYREQVAVVSPSPSTHGLEGTAGTQEMLLQGRNTVEGTCSWPELTWVSWAGAVIPSLSPTTCAIPGKLVNVCTPRLSLCKMERSTVSLLGAGVVVL